MSWNWQTWAGLVGGAVGGVWAGKKFGPSRHRTIAAVVGGVGGAIAGSWAGAALSGAAQLPAGIANSTTLTFAASKTMNQSVKSGTAVSFGVPSGSSMQNLTIDGQQVLGGAVAVYGPVTLGVGTHTINAQWTDSANVTNQGIITLTVTP